MRHKVGALLRVFPDHSIQLRRRAVLDAARIGRSTALGQRPGVRRAADDRPTLARAQRAQSDGDGGQSSRRLDRRGGVHRRLLGLAGSGRHLHGSVLSALRHRAPGAASARRHVEGRRRVAARHRDQVGDGAAAAMAAVAVRRCGLWRRGHHALAASVGDRRARPLRRISIVEGEGLMRDYYSRKDAKHAKFGIAVGILFRALAPLRQISSCVHIFSDSKVTPIY